MSQIININGSAQFDEVAVKSTLPVLVDFWAPWCMPCQMMAPVLEELSKHLDGKLQIAKVDTEITENQKIAIQYQIQSIPNLKLFKNGKVVKEFVGFRPKDIFVKELEEALK